MQKRIALLLASWLLIGCSKPAPLTLDVDQAIASTNAFIKELMRGNYADAYVQFMSSDLKYNPATDQEQFVADWQAIMEKYGAMQKAVFDSYQLVPGKRVLQLYYRVQHAKAGEIVYHLITQLDSRGAFKLFLVDVGNAQPYPPGVAKVEPKLKKEPAPEVVP